jgi:hypothetical protein
MKQIVEYKTIKSKEDYFEDFGNMVNESIKQGFQPLGSPYIAIRTEGQALFACQAMVRYNESK